MHLHHHLPAPPENNFPPPVPGSYPPPPPPPLTMPSHSSTSFSNFGDPLTLDPSVPVLTRLHRTHNQLLSHPCTGSFDSRVHRAINITHADTSGCIKAEILVEAHMCSDRKTMHGSCGSLLIDLTTCASLITLARPGYWALEAPGTSGKFGFFAGATRNLEVTWVRPAKVGEVLEIRCQPVEVRPGKAVVRCEVRSRKTKGLLFFGKHELESVVRKMGMFEDVTGTSIGEKVRARL